MFVIHKLQFIAASATLEDAKDISVSNCLEKKCRLIQGSGKKGETDFVMLFPTLRTQRKLMVELTKKLTR